MSHAKGTQAQRRRMQRRNHPDRGAAIKVEPLRDRAFIASILVLLQDKPRDLCLFTLGINTAYRANELLSLQVGDVMHLIIGDTLTRKQSKTGEYRYITVNGAVFEVLRTWLSSHPDPQPKSPLFISRKTGEALTVSTLGQMVKDWCAKVGATGNYASHTLRKTWGYQQRVWKHAPLSLLVRAFGHKSEAQTLDYLGIVPQEIQDLYINMELDMTHLKDEMTHSNKGKQDDIDTALLLFHDDLNSFLSVIGFYCESVATLSEHSLQGIDHSHRGTVEMGKRIVGEGHIFSQRLAALRQQVQTSSHSTLNDTHLPDSEEK